MQVSESEPLLDRPRTFPSKRAPGSGHHAASRATQEQPLAREPGVTTCCGRRVRVGSRKTSDSGFQFPQWMLVGCVSLLLQAAFNQAISELLQYQEGLADGGGNNSSAVAAAAPPRLAVFNQPLLSIYVNHSGMALLLLLAAVLRHRRLAKQAKRDRRDAPCCSSCSPRGVLACVFAPWKAVCDDAGWSWQRALCNSVLLAVLYLIPNVAWAVAISRVSVTVNISVQQSQSAFVYVLSVIFLRKPLTWLPPIAVLICLGGVVVMAIAMANASKPTDGNGVNAGLLDVLVCLGYPVGIAFYVVLWRRMTRATAGAIEHVAALMSMVGWANLLVLWPLMVIAAASGLEQFEWPDFTPVAVTGGHSVSSAGLYLANMILATCFNLSYMAGIAATSALFMSVGGLLFLPVSAVTDAVLHGDTFGIGIIAGTALTCVGFAILTLSEGRKSEQEGRAAPVKADASGIMDVAAPSPAISVASGPRGISEASDGELE